MELKVAGRQAKRMRTVTSLYANDRVKEAVDVIRVETLTFEKLQLYVVLRIVMSRA